MKSNVQPTNAHQSAAGLRGLLLLLCELPAQDGYGLEVVFYSQVASI